MIGSCVCMNEMFTVHRIVHSAYNNCTVILWAGGKYNETAKQANHKIRLPNRYRYWHEISENSAPGGGWTLSSSKHTAELRVEIAQTKKPFVFGSETIVCFSFSLTISQLVSCAQRVILCILFRARAYSFSCNLKHTFVAFSLFFFRSLFATLHRTVLCT